MLNYAETASTRTIVPVESVPWSPSQHSTTLSKRAHESQPTSQRQLHGKHMVYPNALRALIKTMGYTFREVSRETGVPERTLYDWASGIRPIPRDAREKLTRLLFCTQEELVPPSRGTTLDPQRDTHLLLSLSALLSHPEFQRGLVEAYDQFEGDYEPAPLTEDEMVDEVESNLSRRVTERCKKLAQRLGWNTPPSYLYNLGFVVGTIDKGLSYAR